MPTVATIKRRLKEVFDVRQAEVLAEVITEAYSDLIRTGDFNELKEIVRDLSEAQKKTEQRLNELAEAQKKTEQRVNELAEAQKRTERELRLLTSEHRKTREQLGGLAMTVGYRLEDEAFKALPDLLERDYGIKVEGRLRRCYLADREGKKIEVNIFGSAVRDGRKLVIIGEGKSQLSKRGVREFINRKLRRFEGVFEEIFPVLVTYMISEPDAEDYARERGVAVYYSYDF